MRFLHVSIQNLGHEHMFIPRVPLYRAMGEDNKVLRICVAKTVEECLLGIEGNDIDALLRNCPESLLNSNTFLFLYQLESNDWTIPSDDLVPDASMTGEHWILQATLGKLISILDTVQIRQVLEGF